MDEQERIGIACAVKNRDFVWNYCIKDYQRCNARKAWEHCYNTGVPMNCLLEFSFKQGLDCRDDVEMVRRLSRWTRVSIRSLGLETYMLWTRHVKFKTNVENVALVVHVNPENLEWFIEIAQGWDFGRNMTQIKATAVDQSECITIDDKKYTVFDYMMRSMDPMSRRQEPAALWEMSEPLFKPVVFQSLKIERQVRFVNKFDKTIDG